MVCLVVVIENIIGTIVFMDFDIGLEINDFAFAYDFKGNQPESSQVTISPSHGVGHYFKHYLPLGHV